MGRGGGVKIFSQTMRQSLNQLISNKGACRTAPATQGPLNMYDYGQTRLLDIHTYGQGDSMTDPAQRAESVKIFTYAEECQKSSVLFIFFLV